MIRIIFFLCFVLFFGGVAAQQLTLDTAIAIALKNSPGLMISRYNIDIATINNNYGIAGGLPLIQGNLNATQQMTSLKQEYSNPLNNKNSTNANSTSLNSGVAASMPIYEGTRIVNEKKRLEVVESQTKLQYSSRAQTLIYNVMLKYYDIIRQQGYARTLEASIRASNQRLEIVKQQQSVGVANDADLFQSQVELNTQVQSLTAQELVIQQAKTDLLTLLYLNPDSSIVVRDTIIVDKLIRLDSILSAAYLNPDIQAAYEQIRINQYLEREVGAARYPSASLNLGFNFSRTTNPQGFNILNQAYGPYLGLGVTVPIFNGGIYKRQEQIAGINVNSAKLQKDTLMMNVQSTAVKNWQAYLNNLKQLETAQQNFELSWM
jgi:outer membrane protein